MSRNLIEKQRQRFAKEQGLQPPSWGGRVSVALVYPNTYHPGMRNLGLQAVYAMLNSREDARCERFFLPDPDDLAEHQRTGFPLHSLETQRPLSDFDLVAFSLSFENDYLNLPTLFELCRMPLWANERDDRHPLVLCGGVCAFLNPEPLAEIMDLFAVGEAEVLLPGILEKLASSDDRERADLLNELARSPGIYVPSLYDVSYAASGWPSYRAHEGIPSKVQRQWANDLDVGQARTCVATPDTEFGDMTLIEVSRGCPRACRFCAAGFIYRPFRQHSLEHLKSEVDGSVKVGLVAAAVTDYADLAALGRTILNQGGEVSVSSVRIDAITPEQVAVLEESGHKTLALAPEAGSQRMRDVINKGIDEQQILDAVQMIVHGEIPNLKLYFMLGLPTETDDDVDAIISLTEKIRDIWQAAGKRRGRLGRLVVSVNPFVPKPWTPLQWAPMEKRSRLEKKVRRLQKAFGRLPNVDLNSESLRSAELQGLLARGDRRVGGSDNADPLGLFSRSP